MRDWKAQGPKQQLAEQCTGPYDTLWATHSSLKLRGVQPWTHHPQVHWALPEDADPAAVLDSEGDSWSCTPGGHFKVLFQKRTVIPNTR